MKRIFALFLVICALFLTSCGVVKFEYTDGMLVNSKNGNTYNALPTGFEPCGVGDVYGRFGAFSLYRVQTPDGEELPTETWLTEEYAGNATVVYLSSKEPVPSFRAMSFDKCYICIEDENVMSIGEIEDKEVLNTIISALDSENTALWPRVDLISTYSLKFHSNDLPAVFYSLVYCECDSGNYLYDRASNTCVEVGDLMSEWIESE